MHRHQQRRLKIRTAIFVIFGTLLAFGLSSQAAQTQDSSSTKIFIPLITAGNGAPQPGSKPETLEYDFGSPTEDQARALTAAVESAGLHLERGSGTVTILHDENGKRRTVMTLNCLDKKCKNVSASSIEAIDGLKITIRVNGTIGAIVEQVSRKMVVVSFLVNDVIVDTIEFRCRACDLEIDIPAEMTESHAHVDRHGDADRNGDTNRRRAAYFHLHTHAYGHIDAYGSARRDADPNSHADFNPCG